MSFSKKDVMGFPLDGQVLFKLRASRNLLMSEWILADLQPVTVTTTRKPLNGWPPKTKYLETVVNT